MATYSKIGSLTNLFTNPSFEVDSTSWGAINVNSISVGNAYVKYGVNALTLNANGNGWCGVFCSQVLTVTPGLTYFTSIWVAADPNNNLQNSILPRVEWYDATNALINITYGDSSLIAFGAFVLTQLSAVAPANAAYAVPCFYTTTTVSNSDQFYFDGALFAQTSTYPSYFDGSFVSSFTDRYSWSGATNASVSIYSLYSETGSTYRYLFADLLTNQIVAELPITGVGFTQNINAAGTFQGHIQLAGLPLGSNASAATIPGRCAIYVDRNGVLVWGGVIWYRNWSSASQTLSITAREFISYFERRRIKTTRAFVGVDQLSVAQGLISDAQSVTNGNIGVAIGSETSGVSIYRVYYNYEQKTVFQALEDLSKAGNGLAGSAGFDFAIDVAYDGSGNPTKTLKLGYPRIGSVYSSTATSTPVFEFPAGNVAEYEYPEDGSITANAIYATGAGSNEGQLVFSSVDSNKLSAGWPLLEDASSYSDVLDSTMLTNLAAGQLAGVSYPPTILKIVAKPNIDPELGSYRVGDDARVRIRDDFWPNGLDATYRITGLTVSPGETGPERVTLTLTLPNS